MWSDLLSARPGVDFARRGLFENFVGADPPKSPKTQHLPRLSQLLAQLRLALGGFPGFSEDFQKRASRFPETDPIRRVNRTASGRCGRRSHRGLLAPLLAAGLGGPVLQPAASGGAKSVLRCQRLGWN